MFTHNPGTFFVPHDPSGLAGLMGGNEIFAQQFDSLFLRDPVTQEQGIYYIGTPLFKDMQLKHKNGTLSRKANRVFEIIM